MAGTRGPRRAARGVFRSITRRIIVLHVAAVIVTATVMPLVLYLFMSAAVQTLHRRALQEQAEWLARHLQYRPDGRLSLTLPEGLVDLFSPTYGRYTYAVLDRDGVVLFSSNPDAKPVFPPGGPAFPDEVSGTDDVQFLETTVDGHVIEGASIRKEIEGRTVWVQLGENLSHRDVLLDDVTAQFLHKVGWITVPILLLLLAAAIAIVRGALKPLREASAQAQNISPVRIDVRLPVEGLPDEVLPLVIAVNQALDRLAEGYRVQREFASDAAHELRTPLAILRTRIDTLPDRELARTLSGDVANMSRLVSQLLEAADLDTVAVGPDERAELNEVCEDVIALVGPLALAQGRMIELRRTAKPVVIRGDPEMLRRAVRNLSENALHHTPPGTDVRIVVSDDATITVLDEGPGIAPADRENIFRRFWRGDGGCASGAGLGLAIVKRIVDAHGGSASVENRPGGGAAFILRFAAGPHPPAGA